MTDSPDPMPGSVVRCPACGSADSIPVIYGLIRDFGGLDKVYPDGYVLGGCMLPFRPADRQCRSCDERFGSDPGNEWGNLR